MKSHPTSCRVLELLHFDPDTGVFRWANTIGSRAKEGDIAGSITSRGDRVIRIDGQSWRAHHLAWLIHTGEWPDGIVVHVNRDNDDNRTENMRISTKEEAHAHTKAEPVDANNVHEIFIYENGKLLWRASLSGKSRVAGEIAGYMNDDGYIVVEVGGRAVGGHRIVWLMHKGKWPRGEIDHRNGVRHDNRIENLREVTRITNSENRRNAPITSRSGLLGAESLPSGRFRSRIRSKGLLYELGIFDTAKEAHAAYVSAKRAIHAGNTL